MLLLQIRWCLNAFNLQIDTDSFCVYFFVVFYSLVAIPVYVKHNISFREGSSQGRFELTLGPKQTMGKAVESVLVSSQLPRGVLNANLNPSQGTYTFDPVTKVRLSYVIWSRCLFCLQHCFLCTHFYASNVYILLSIWNVKMFFLINCSLHTLFFFMFSSNMHAWSVLVCLYHLSEFWSTNDLFALFI